MGRVDLDMVEAALEAGLLLDKRHWSDLVAELRDAREVIDRLPGVGRLLALADWLDTDDKVHGRVGDEVQQELRAVADALAAYDRHVQHSDDPGSERDGE